MKIAYNEMVRAMCTNDSRYDGTFYIGVHSTGIYCLPSCKARLPLLKNVRFYFSREEAISAALRPCRRCRPELYPNTLPEWLPRILEYMNEQCNERLTEGELMRIGGVDISTIRRHFKAHLDQSPLAFHRRLRLLQAHRMIEDGDDYLTAAFSCGYHSVSGFRDAYRRTFGHPPGGVHVRN